MMEEKVYYNEELEEILNRHIKEEKYGGFKPLLNEIFQRRAYEYRFDHQHMKKEVINFVKNVDEIKFGKNIPGMPKNMWATSRYMLGKRGKLIRGWIYFNCDSDADLMNMMKNDKNCLLELYEMLTHEVYHKIVQNKNIFGLANHATGEGKALDEIITETAAHRTTFSRTEVDDENFRQGTVGYDKMTFIVNILATNFGLEEREFLTGGIQNREELQKVCKKYISEEDYQNDISFCLDKLERNLDSLYNDLYLKNNLNDSGKIISMLKEICCGIFDIANICVAKNTKEINEEYAEELAYAFQKNRVIMMNNIQRFIDGGIVTEGIAYQTLGEIFSSEESLEFLNRVSDIMILTSKKSQIEDKSTWQEMEQLAKNGELIDNAEKFGIKVQGNPTFRELLIKSHKKANKEFENPIQWDNKRVIEIMEQLWNEKEIVDVGKLEQELDSQTVTQKIKNFVAKFKNRKQRKLNAPGENGEDSFVEPKSDFDERCKVPPEKLQPLKPSTKPKKIEKENGKE